MAKRKPTIFDTAQEESISERNRILGTQKKQKTTKNRYCIYLTDEERAKLEGIANPQATSLTQVIRNMINDYQI